MHDESLYAERALRAVARGYVMKRDMTEKLLFRSSGSSPVEQLSDRELEVFRMLGQGIETRRIAELLRISMKTVQVYYARIKDKMNIPNATELLREAVRWWDLLAAQSNVDQAVALKPVAKEFPNPTFSLNASKINTPSSRTNSTPQGNRLWDRSYDTVMAINQLFEIGGKRAARQASAQAGADAAQASFLDARRTLDLAVSKAYITALLAQANVGI